MKDKDSLFLQVLTDNKDRIFRICCAYVNDSDDRDDLFQEIIINIWKNLDKFEGRSLISTWIYRVAVNTALMHIKSTGKRKKLHSDIDVETLNIPEDKGREEAVNTGSQVGLLYKSIAMLAELDRLIISMVLEDLPYKEISDVTGLTVNNVGVRINRIKKELNRIMGEKNNGN